MNDRRAAEPRKLFDMSFSLDTVLTIIGMVAAVVTAFYALSGRVDKIEGIMGNFQSQIGEVNARLDGMTK